MRNSIVEISAIIFCLFTSLVSQNAYGKWSEFILIDENILIFDEEEPDEWYIDNHLNFGQKGQNLAKSAMFLK